GRLISLARIAAKTGRYLALLGRSLDNMVGAALNRLADDNHPLLLLEQGDLVIFSSIIIPDNEMLISRLVEKFNARNIQTLQSHDTELPIHVSGHPNRGELDLLYRWV